MPEESIKPPVVLPGSGNNITINPTQRLNPILEYVRNVGKEFGEIVADYQVGRTTGVIFLSLKYHRLHPEYIHQRIEKLGRAYSLRILLLWSDINESKEPIREITKYYQTCLINNVTVLVAFTAEQAGHYISMLKQYEFKPPDLIKERVDKDYSSVLRSALTSISKVNKTDVETLRSSIGSFAQIAKASPDQLQNLPGFGQVKVKKIKDAFEKPFRNQATSHIATNATQSQASAPHHGSTLRSKSGRDIQERGRSTSPIRNNDSNIPPNSRSANEKDVDATISREPGSPVWDTELDLDGSASPSHPTVPDVQTLQSKRKRSPSPVWDIELDLND